MVVETTVTTTTVLQFYQTIFPSAMVGKPFGGLRAA